MKAQYIQPLRDWKFPNGLVSLFQRKLSDFTQRAPLICAVVGTPVGEAKDHGCFFSEIHMRTGKYMKQAENATLKFAGFINNYSRKIQDKLPVLCCRQTW